MDNKDIKTLDDLREETESNVEIVALRSQVEGLKKEMSAMQKDYGNLEGYFRDVTTAAAQIALPPAPVIYKPPEKEKEVTSPCVVVVHFTDWHMGAVQDPDEIEGLPGFSPESLDKRMHFFVEDFIKYIYVQRHGYKINECVILDTGDNISGDIHRDLQITNAFPTPVQAVKCGMLKAKIYTEIAAHFEKVRVEFLTGDNHGRLTAKPQAKQQGLNTHNYTVGHIAKIGCANQKNVAFNIHTSASRSVKVINRQYLITHGHDVRGWAGFPYYGIERKVGKEATARLWDPPERKFHKIVMGHWHVDLKHPHYWIGPSASGTDALDHKNGRRGEPAQVFWMVHPKRGEFNRNAFLLRDK